MNRNKPTSPLRVALVISNLEYGGAQRQVVELVNQLDPGVIDARICSLSSHVPLAADLRDRSRLHVILKRFKFDATVVPRLATWLRRERIRVVHGYLFDAEIAARLAGRLAGCAVIGSERNTDYSLKKRQLIVYRMTRSCMDLIIANSRAGAEFNRRLLGQDAARYRVVHNGVDVERFHPRDPRQARIDAGLPLDVPLVGMFASFKAQKNHPLAFEAARLVLDQLPTTRFLFVGDMLYAGMHGSDRYKADMQRRVDELRLRDACIFLGNRDDVAALYSACDLTILPSHFEGTPNVVLESLACGVPVVATNVSDNAYIVPDGRVGFIVPPGDAAALAQRIVELLTDTQLRARLGRQARQWMIDEFSVTRLAEKTAAVYVEAYHIRP